MKLRVPRRFEKATLEGLAPAFHDVRSFAEDMDSHLREGKGLLLAGPPGVGKTWAVSALTRAYVASKSRTSVHRSGDHEFATSPDLVQRLNDMGHGLVYEAQSDVDYDAFRDQMWWTTYLSVPWLVVNDLGKEYRGGKLAEQVAFKIGRVLRLRSEKRLVTHITTNLGGRDISATYGESIASLLAEMTIPVAVFGEDRRR